MSDYSGGFKLSLIAVVVMLSIVRIAGATYWYQTGVEGSPQTGYNGGGSVSIQTVSQNNTSGVLGFWIGETLSNGAFIQVGYTIQNKSGTYETNCTIAGCSSSVYVSAGSPSWFWEYFPADYFGSSFLGSIGSSGSAGQIGSFNTYSFNAIGNIWNLYFNDKQIGSVDLGTSTSASNPITAFAEDSEVGSNNTFMNVVKFRNLSFYQNGKLLLAPEGLSYIGYGKGSDQFLKNPYGVEEINNQVNYFQIGSEIPYIQNFTKLWNYGYGLEVKSTYTQNVTPSGNYSAYSRVKLQAPTIIYITPTTREEFVGWVGSGSGSYTGYNNSTTVTMYGDIVETANWKTQFYLNVSSSYEGAYGSGWYDNGSIATVGINSSIVNQRDGSRMIFKNWSAGSNSTVIKIIVNRPISIAVNWMPQYLVNATSPYGIAYGSGWYDNNSLVRIYISNQTVQLTNNSRLEFGGWSNGYANSSINLRVNKSIVMDALFYKQYLVRFSTYDQSGRPINVTQIYLDGKRVSQTTYMYPNETYNVSYAYYKGAEMPINRQIMVAGSENIALTLPVYDVIISASSVFGLPVNASINVTFENGTRIVRYLGNSGMLALSDVPLGYVQGSAEYFGTTSGINIQSGESAALTFITLDLIAIVVAVIAVISFILIFGEELHKRIKNKARA